MEPEFKRKYYSISEVAEMMGLKSHILRFWESSFSVLRPRKNRAGNRAYTERDIKIVKLIKHLLYDEKFTIQGAVNRLKVDREFLDTQLSLPLESPVKQTVLDDIRYDLQLLIEKVEEL